MNVLFCASSRKEIDEVKIDSGFRGRGKASFLYTGVGIKDPSDFRDRICKGRYDLVVNAGVAGILNESYQIFDVVFPERYILASSGEVIKLQIPELEEKDWKFVSIVTVDRPIQCIAERRFLWERYHADVVDMESYYLVSLAMEEGVSFVSVKVLTDRADSRAVQDCFGNLDRARKILTDAVLDLVGLFGG